MKQSKNVFPEESTSVLAQKMLSPLEFAFAKGYPDQIKRCPDEKLAKQWLAEQERNALLGIQFPQVRASEHTLSEAIDCYIAEELPRKPRNAGNVERHLKWFREKLGDYALSAIRPSLLNE